jgi:rhodanese-related sulfurtransferase
MERAAGVAVAGEAVVAQGVIGGARMPRAEAVAAQAVGFRLVGAVVAVRRHPRRFSAARPQAERDHCGAGEESTRSQDTPRSHAGMLPCPAVARRLALDAALYLAAALLVGTAANLVPSRHVNWWGRGQEPPKVGTDFQFIDPASADALRTNLPNVVFVDTRSPAEFAAGHVPGALNFGLTNFQRHLTQETDARLQHADAVIIYGASEETDVEQLLAQALRLRGFAPPYVLIGGFPAWQAGALDIERASP